MCVCVCVCLCVFVSVCDVIDKVVYLLVWATRYLFFFVRVFVARYVFNVIPNFQHIFKVAYRLSP